MAGEAYCHLLIYFYSLVLKIFVQCRCFRIVMVSKNMLPKKHALGLLHLVLSSGNLVFRI
jgi:hypothetical protein